MLKKSFAFGLLAAGLMFAPGIASAQRQTNDQFIDQSGAAEGGSVVEQDARLNNRQINVNQDNRCYGRTPNGRQDSTQTAVQSGAAFDHSVVDQRANARNTQINATTRTGSRSSYKRC